MSTGSIPPNIGLAISALLGPYLPDVSPSEVVRRLTTAAGSEPLTPKGYSITEAARIIGVSRRKAYSLIHSGRLPVVTLGHRTKRVPHASLVAMLTPAAPPAEG